METKCTDPCCAEPTAPTVNKDSPKKPSKATQENAEDSTSAGELCTGVSDHESSDYWEQEDEPQQLYPQLSNTFLPADYWKYDDKLMDDPISPYPDYPIVEGRFADDDEDEYMPATPATGQYAGPYAKWSDGVARMDTELRDADGYDGDYDEMVRAIRRTFPRQRLRKTPFKHRQQISRDCLFNSMVARPVGKKELEATPEAIKAMKDEWTKLQNKGVWEIDPKYVKDWCEVQKSARLGGYKCLVGKVFGICVEKSSERSDKQRKFKGRYVYQGNWVRDENSEVALFTALSSAPASLEASKFVDAVGLQPGFDLMQADAKQAYVQADLKSDTRKLGYIATRMQA